jgi:osmotically-inducible protein OsmY
VPIADSTGVVTAASLVAAIAVRRGQLQGPTTDAEVEELMYDALELLPGAADVEVRCENGRVTITGSVQHKRTKRDVGEVAWAIPSVNDVQNNVSIVSRRRARTAGRDADAPASVSARKQG